MQISSNLQKNKSSFKVHNMNTIWWYKPKLQNYVNNLHPLKKKKKNEEKKKKSEWQV